MSRPINPSILKARIQLLDAQLSLMGEQIHSLATKLNNLNSRFDDKTLYRESLEKQLEALDKSTGNDDTGNDEAPF